MNEINIKNLNNEQLLDLQKQITKQLEKKVTQEQFNKLFFKLWKEKCLNYRFMENFFTESDTPTSIIEFFDNDNRWMIKINYDVEETFFLVRYYGFWNVLTNELGLTNVKTQEFMKNVLVEHFKLNGVSPQFTMRRVVCQLVEHLK